MARSTESHFRLGVLDQSPVSSGVSSGVALANTIELARTTERLGYQRFWVAEHHNDRAFASASPEILIARIASVTRTIRVGAGGVLLGHYSPFKVAEQFRLLASLFPDRIDLGIGRSTGTDPRTTAELAAGRPRTRGFGDVAELRRRLAGGDSDGVHAVPLNVSPPPLWLLGTSPESALYAATAGLPYAFGGFIDSRHLPEALATYHRHFVPSAECSRPHTIVGVHLLCAETRARALELVRPIQCWFARTVVHGENVGFPSLSEAARVEFSRQEQALLDLRMQDDLIDTPDACAQRLNDLASAHGIDEFAIVTITPDFAARVRSYELLSSAVTQLARASA